MICYRFICGVVHCHRIKLRVKYPFIGTKLKAKSRKQKNYMPPVIPNLIGNPRFKLLKSKNRTFVAVQIVDSRLRVRKNLENNGNEAFSQRVQSTSETKVSPPRNTKYLRTLAFARMIRWLAFSFMLQAFSFPKRSY